VHLFNNYSINILLTKKTNWAFNGLLGACRTKHPVFVFPRHCKYGLFSAGTFQFSAFLKAAEERSLLCLSHIQTILLPEVISHAAGVAEVNKC